MFNEDLENNFKGMFGKTKPGYCRLSMNGNIAVKCGNGYKTYDVKKGTLTNVTNFCFPVGDDMFFIIPTNKVEIGDIILVDGHPRCVIGTNKKTIEVIDYGTSEVKTIVPEHHVFMGSSYFYGKIVSLFSGAIKGEKGYGKLMKMMMMSQMLGGNNDGGNGLGQMMAMSMFMGKDSNPFEGAFDFGFDIDSEDAEDTDAEPSKDKEE